jgi:hypothetical protein
MLALRPGYDPGIHPGRARQDSNSTSAGFLILKIEICIFRFYLEICGEFSFLVILNITIPQSEKRVNCHFC